MKVVDVKPSCSAQLICFIAVVWLLVIAASVAVIYVTYDTRKQFNALENLRFERNNLQVSWRQYLLEESTWATYSRIERLASGSLDMHYPEANQMIRVDVK